MKLTEDNCYLISAGQDRFIYVWKCQHFYKANNKHSKSSAPDFSLAMDDTVISMDVQSVKIKLTEKEMEYLKQIQTESSDKKNARKKKLRKIKSTKTVYHICGASKSAVYVWRYDPIAVHERIKAEGSDFRLEPCCKITVARKVKGTSADILDLSYFRHIRFMEDGQRVMVLRGTQMIPIAKAVKFLSDGAATSSPSFISKIEVEHVDASGVLDGNKVDLSSNVDTALKQQKVDEHMTVLHVADRSRPSPKMFDGTDMIDDGKASKKKKKEKKRKRSNDDDDDSKMVEGPATKRQKKESESATFQEKLFEIERQTEMAMRNGTATIPNANSLYHVLTQSLKSNVECSLCLLCLFYLCLSIL